MIYVVFLQVIARCNDFIFSETWDWLCRSLHTLSMNTNVRDTKLSGWWKLEQIHCDWCKGTFSAMQVKKERGVGRGVEKGNPSRAIKSRLRELLYAHTSTHSLSLSVTAQQLGKGQCSSCKKARFIPQKYFKEILSWHFSFITTVKWQPLQSRWNQSIFLNTAIFCASGFYL